MIWEKGGTKGEDSQSRREPPLFLSRISTIGRRTLSLSRCRFWCSHKRNPPGTVVLGTSFVELDTTQRKDDESGETQYGVFRKKKKRIGGGFFPVLCVFERDWKRNSFWQNRQTLCDALVGRKRVAHVVVARHGSKVRRSLSLSLCVSLFFVCSREIPFGRARRSGHSFLIYI